MKSQKIDSFGAIYGSIILTCAFSPYPAIEVSYGTKAALIERLASGVNKLINDTGHVPEIQTLLRGNIECCHGFSPRSQMEEMQKTAHAC